MKRATVGGSRMIFGRSSSLHSDGVNGSAWDRIMWIADIQARIWNYTGPYGFGDMDMLGILLLLAANEKLGTED